ncbi:acyl-CoA dehydrogenase family protein [Nocardia sp. CWNU-33]|uniref:acyl-CoA dehydrogenase family protein n=1 Tax=Nocardia sp. CWNU-33 TaxID=3392117 RepID=UPI00398F5150
MTVIDTQPMASSYVDPPDPDSAPHLLGPALRGLVFGSTYAAQRQVRDTLFAMDEPPNLGGSEAQEAHYGYQQLQRIGEALGGSWVAIAKDPSVQAALYDWSMVRYPRAVQYLSHSGLGIESILKLGNGSRYQQDCLRDLDTGDAIGVFAATELGCGTNVLDLGTQAVWHRDGGYLTLHTPDPASAKWMPNCQDPAVPKIVVVLARLYVDGADEGVFPILTRLRGPDGLAEGVEVAALPTGRLSAPMDHAAFYFRDMRVPADALLGGTWAYFDESGDFVCDLDRRSARFKRSSAALMTGRISYSGAAVAAARAGWTLTVRYACQRVIDGTQLADRDEAQRKLVSAAARLVAMSALVNYTRAQLAGAALDPLAAVLAMVTKPIASDTAHQTLTDVSRLCGAQSVLSDNMFGDWLGCITGVCIAEGINDSLRVAVGRLPQLVADGQAPAHMDLSQAQLPGLPDHLPWWHTMLHSRQDTVVTAATAGAALGSTAIGTDSAAVDVYTVIAERLAADALAAAAADLDDPDACALAEDLVAVYALERINADAAWFFTHGGLTVERAAQMRNELTARYTALAPHLGTIAAAFDVPELPAPIDHDYMSSWMSRLGWQDRW